jgi:hypothetical protein
VLARRWHLASIRREEASVDREFLAGGEDRPGHGWFQGYWPCNRIFVVDGGEMWRPTYTDEEADSVISEIDERA